MTAPRFSAITPLAYDASHALRYCIPAYYELVDEIILGLDRQSVSWSGKPYDLDYPAFHRGLFAIDVECKAQLVRANFHAAPNDGNANDTLTHNVLGLFADPDHWQLHVDADEVLVAPDADRFRDYFAAVDPHLDVYLQHREVYKLLGDGTALVIDRDNGYSPTATRALLRHTRSRHTDRPHVLCPPEVCRVTHFGWGRTREELATKLARWTHYRDTDQWPRMLELWDAANATNYREPQYRNFWPLYSANWPGLRLVSLDEVGVTGRAVAA